MGLRLKEQKGPRLDHQPSLRGQGTSPGSPAGFLGLSCLGKRHPLLSYSSGLASGRALPPASPVLSPASFLCPQGPTWPRGRFGEQGISLGVQQAPSPQVDGANALCSSPTPPAEPLPPTTPDLPWLPSMLPGSTQPGWGFGWGGSGLGAQQAPLPGWPGYCPLLLSCSSWRDSPTCLCWSPWLQGHRSCLVSTSSPPSVPLLPTGSLWGSYCLLGGQSPPPVAGRLPSCLEISRKRILCFGVSIEWILKMNYTTKIIW